MILQADYSEDLTNLSSQVTAVILSKTFLRVFGWAAIAKKATDLTKMYNLPVAINCHDNYGVVTLLIMYQCPYLIIEADKKTFQGFTEMTAEHTGPTKIFNSIEEFTKTVISL